MNLKKNLEFIVAPERDGGKKESSLKKADK